MLGEEKKIKACINIISSRKRCIKPCLKSLWDNFNEKYEYPTYVYYFDDIYDSAEFQGDIRKSISKNIFFRQVPYRTPEFLDESELFYNRNNLWYSRQSFPISRKGYLHMCHFKSNIYGYENTELEEYDYIMIQDDEAGYDKKMSYNPFEVMAARPEIMGAYVVGKRLKDGSPHQGHLDTRVGLWQLTKDFLIDNNIVPKSKQLQILLNDERAEWNFHFLDWCDTYVIKTEMFKSDLWKKWIIAVNESGGIYKYRWGDNEVMSLFAHIYDTQIYNLKTVEEGYHNQGLFRGVQNIAPNIKNLKR